MTTVRTSRRPVQVVRLSFADGQVIVTPEDQDKFFISAENAINACRDAVRNDERIEQFKSKFLVPLHEWAVAHGDKARACYIAVPGRYIQVFIVTTSRRFDLELAETVARLELQLVKSGWCVGTSQLPDTDEESLATYFDQEGALEVYARPRPAPHQGSE